jgi:hypothetical protein
LKIAETNDYLYLTELTERIYNLTTTNLWCSNIKQIIKFVWCLLNARNRNATSFNMPYFLRHQQRRQPLPTKIGDGSVLFEIVAVNISDWCHIRDTVFWPILACQQYQYHYTTMILMTKITSKLTLRLCKSNILRMNFQCTKCKWRV